MAETTLLKDGGFFRKEWSACPSQNPTIRKRGEIARRGDPDTWEIAGVCLS